MGVLIFAFRKLFLIRRLNQLNARNMQLSQTRQRVTDQIGVWQRTKAAAQSAYSMMLQNTATQNSSIFQSTLNSYSGYVFTKSDELKAAREAAGNDPNNNIVQNAQRTLDEAKEQAQRMGMALTAQYNGAQQQLAMQQNQMNQQIEASDNGELQALQMKDAQIDEEMAANESVEKQLNYELEEVKKAEDSAAKNGAPNFGLA